MQFVVLKILTWSKYLFLYASQKMFRYCSEQVHKILKIVSMEERIFFVRNQDNVLEANILRKKCPIDNYILDVGFKIH